MGDPVISVARVRGAMQLVGEVHELGARSEPGRRHFLAGVMKLVGCSVGGVVHDRGYGPGMKRGIAAATLSGFDSQVMDVFDSHQTEGSDINPYHRAVMDRVDALVGGEVFTATNQELVERKAWDGSVWINEYVRPARMDHFMGSMRIVGRTSGVGCGFMRQAGDRPFTDEDREVLHLVHVGIGAFFDHSSPRFGLAPRVRDVLDGMLEGASDKEIALRLRISPHTVRQYVKTILRAFGVASRAQLIAAKPSS